MPKQMYANYRAVVSTVHVARYKPSVTAVVSKPRNDQWSTYMTHSTSPAVTNIKRKLYVICCREFI